MLQIYLASTLVPLITFLWLFGREEWDLGPDPQAKATVSGILIALTFTPILNTLVTLYIAECYVFLPARDFWRQYRERRSRKHGNS